MTSHCAKTLLPPITPLVELKRCYVNGLPLLNVSFDKPLIEELFGLIEKPKVKKVVMLMTSHCLASHLISHLLKNYLVLLLASRVISQL